MLGLDNPIHILFVLVVLLLVFGAKRLPEMGKSMGEGLRGFKDSISGDSSIAHMTEDDRPARVDELTPAPAPVVVEPAADRTARQAPLTPAA
jgi:sec-independent protein translocase protein TatA